MLKEELKELLHSRYPLLYSRSAGQLRDFGIQCEDGWYDIVDRLSAKLEHELVSLAKSGVAESALPRPVLVKEKYGTLRFHLDQPTPSMRDAIEAAQQESATTCEMCGEPGMMRQGTWLRVRCDECEAHRNSRW